MRQWAQCSEARSPCSWSSVKPGAAFHTDAALTKDTKTGLHAAEPNRFFRTRSVVVAVKKVAIIPTLLTLGNAVCGFAAIAAASKIGRGDASAAAYSNDPYFALSGLLI